MTINAIVLILVTGFFIATSAMAQIPMNTTDVAAIPVQTQAAQQENSTPPAQFVQGELLVRFDPLAFPSNGSREAAEIQANAVIGAVMITDFSDDGLAGLQLVRLPPGMNTSEGIEYYQTIPTVMYAEPNAVYSIASTNVTDNSTAPPAVNTTGAGGLFVRFNATAFDSLESLDMYSNTTHAVINASVITDYSPYGLSGLQLIGLMSPMTVPEGIAYYQNITHVLYAEPNIQYQVMTTPVNVTVG